MLIRTLKCSRRHGHPPALLDGTMTLVISHPLTRLAHEVIEGMVRSCTGQAGNQTSIVISEIVTRENI
jgi:LacI family transcriptional regulator